MVDVDLRELEEDSASRARSRTGTSVGALRVAALCGDDTARRQLSQLVGLRANSVEVANSFAVGTRTVDTWCADGCPYTRRGGRRRFDLTQVYAWRRANDTSWTAAEALESWVALVTRWVGTEPARHALTHAVALLTDRWHAVLGEQAAQAASALVAACSTPTPRPADVIAARRELDTALPSRLAWDSDTAAVVLPLRLLADACLEPSDASLLSCLARSVAAGLTRGTEQALDACALALRTRR